MKRTTEEIVEALETIKDVCIEYEGGCRNCPLRHSENDSRCGVDDGYPKFWKVKKPEAWRAF